MTVYEIANGELAEGTGMSPSLLNLVLLATQSLRLCGAEFYEMDSLVLIKALEVLSARGNAQIFTGTGDVDSMGVKFFGM